MGKIIGIRISNHELQYTVWENEQPVYGAYPLPPGASEMDVYTKQDVFQDALQTVQKILREAYLTDVGSIVFCIPDWFGFAERMQLWHFAHQAHLPLERLFTESMGAALYAAKTYDDPGDVLILVSSQDAFSLVEYTITSGVAEKTAVYAGSLLPDPDAPLSLIHQSKAGDLRSSNAKTLLVSGDGAFSPRLQHTLRATWKWNGNAAIPLPSDAPLQGLALQCGILEGMSTAGPLLALETTGPYDVYANINGEIGILSRADTTIPVKKTVALPSVSQTKQGVSVTFYEERDDYLRPIGGFTISKETLEEGHISWPEGSAACSLDFDTAMKAALHINNGDDSSRPKGCIIHPHMLWEPANHPAGAAAGAETKDPVLSLIEELFPAIDSLDYGISYAKDPSSAQVQGMIHIRDQLLDVLRGHGITPFGKKGEVFDYHLHNAVAHVADPELPAGTIRDVMHTGYLHGSTVLRYASVVVAN